MPADEGIAAAKHECKAPSPVKQTADAGVEDAFDQDVDGFAASTEARFKHGKTGLHSEHEKRAKQHPAGVDCVDVIGRFDRGVWIGWSRRDGGGLR